MEDRQELIRRIERAALWAWPPKETAYVEGWLLRAGGGRTRRINLAQTLAFAPRADLDKAVARVEAWYAKRALPSCFQLTDLTEPAELDAALAERGYPRVTPTSVLVVDPADVAVPADRRVEILTRPIPSVMNALCDPLLDAATRRARAELFARISKPHVFGLVTEGGEPAAAGLCVVDGELAGLFSLRTVGPFRGRGHARSLSRTLITWARSTGAKLIYLQVEDDNAPALACYRPFGGRRLYGYHYREQTA